MAAWYLALGAAQKPQGGVRVSGSAVISAASGMIYAAFNGAVASGVICLGARGKVQPERVGLYTALLLLAIMIPANWALLRADVSVRQMALPSVVMAQGWGVAGYYLAIAALFLAVATTLAAALAALREGLAAAGLRPGRALFFACAAALALSMAGLTALVGVGYPIAGFACALMLLVLISHL